MKIPFSQFNSKDKSFNVIEGVLEKKEFDKKIDQNLARKRPRITHCFCNCHLLSMITLAFL